MKRTTVKLPDEVDARLRHEAQRRGITISELTREAIQSHLGAQRNLGAAGAGRSGRRDISERIEEILAREVAPSPCSLMPVLSMPTSMSTTSTMQPAWTFC